MCHISYFSLSHLAKQRVYFPFVQRITVLVGKPFTVRHLVNTMRAENTSSVGGHVALRCDVLFKKDSKDSPVVQYKIVFSTDGNAKSSDRLYSGGISQFESPGRGSSSQDTEPHITVRNSSHDKGLYSTLPIS